MVAAACAPAMAARSVPGPLSAERVTVRSLKTSRPSRNSNRGARRRGRRRAGAAIGRTKLSRDVNLFTSSIWSILQGQSCDTIRDKLTIKSCTTHPLARSS